jgi:hypothetical protein
VFAVTAIGDPNVACCHPDADSPVNVTDPNNVPAPVHKLPTWVPVFCVALWNRIPVMNPACDVRNLTPTSTGDVSESVPAGTADAGQIVHGQPDGDAVVNVHDTGAITLPAASTAPDTFTVYTVLVASAADGVNVTVRDAASYDTAPATADPPAGVTVIAVADTGSLNVAVTVELTATSVAPTAGVRDVTVGAVVSGPTDVTNTTSTQ